MLLPDGGDRERIVPDREEDAACGYRGGGRKFQISASQPYPGGDAAFQREADRGNDGTVSAAGEYDRWSVSSDRLRTGVQTAADGMDEEK